MATAETIFMFSAAIHEPPGKSFEELRIDDYLQSYRTTGHPPAPCPQEPTAEHLRSMARLPPLFKPYKERSILEKLDAPPININTTTTVSVVPTSILPKHPSVIPPANPASLPDAHNFFTTTFDGEIYHSICAIPTFAPFSPEELRYYAYLKGHPVPPPSVQPAPFVPSPPQPTNSTNLMFTRPDTDVPPSTETLVSVSAKPEFAGHSVEELRLAYVRAGKELNSSEVFALASSPSPPPPPLLSRSTLFAPTATGGSALSRPPIVRRF